MRKLVVTAALAVVLTGASRSSADLPPPDGQKFVDYAFSIEGLAKFGDFVLLAYPYSLSNGRPTTEHLQLEDGKQASLGRRSGTPKLYAMKKTAYEEWLKGYEPDREAMEDPALAALFGGNQVIACNAKLSPSFQLPTSDPRSTVVEVFRVTRIDDKTCQIEPASGVTKTASGDPPTRVASSDSPTQPPPPKKAGCAGCATPAKDDTPGAVALFLALALAASRRAFGSTVVRPRG
jgi:hypothetical protein